jgi:hypothetical protein
MLVEQIAMSSEISQEVTYGFQRISLSVVEVAHAVTGPQSRPGQGCDLFESHCLESVDDLLLANVIRVIGAAIPIQSRSAFA